ncbi:Arylsulfatase [Planctomycetes bacterium MalM25]|nr:Arylsulfatase [Planctomycetes bacterium MalM25]
MNVFNWKAAWLSLLVVGLATTAASAEKPNVIVIVADDAGYADFGFMDGLSGTTSQVPTPHLDALASRGVTFSRAYVGQSCQPTRAALVTGAYQNRIGNEVVGNNLTSANGPFEGVPTETQTIWDRMKSVGYTTAAVGKWHLGQIEDTPQQLGNRPQNQGVDEFSGIWHGSRTYNVGNTNLSQTQLLREARIVNPNLKTDTVVEGSHSGEYISSTFGDYAVDFIDRQHDSGDPFFLYQSFTAPHTPMHNSPDFNDPRIAGLTGIQKQYASMMLTMDNEIGRILDRVDDPNGDGNTSDSIADNTLIMFINDNGGADAFSSSPNGADNGVLRRGKGSPYEGGIRVPMILAGAGVSQAAEGSVYNAPVHGVDILPTAFAAGGGSFGPNDDPIDGVNLLPHVNGQVNSDPHEAIVHRHRTAFAVIKGDWKLVWSGGSPGTNYQLYNVATDISETSNVAGANPALVAEMTRDLTAYESEFDKQRYAILGRTAEETINLFDHFTFNPGGGGVEGEQVIIGGTVGDGDFEQAGGSGAKLYTESSNWFNASGSEGINFTNTSQTNGSSQAGSRAGMPFNNRVQVNNTGHTVGAEGEVFDISYDFGAGGNSANWTGDETMRLFLFTTNSTVDGNLTTGDITIVAEATYDIDRANDPQWTSHDTDGFYTATAGDVGKEFFLGMEFEDASGPSLFPRIDVVELIANGVSGGEATVTNWSKSGAWFEGGTTNVETMFHSDAFAGAVIEFATADGFSYVSNNDMVRSTGQAFMMNSLILSGDFGGSVDQSATIEGNEVLLTDSLDGAAPTVVASANESGGSAFTFNVDLDLVLYDDLVITGDGDAAFRINGQIRDYFDARGVTKQGLSTVTMTAANTYSGDTVVEQGTLALSGAASIANSPVIDVRAGATLDASGHNSGGLQLGSGQTLKGEGEVAGDVVAATNTTVAPGSSPGQLTVTGDYSQQTGATLEIELGSGIDFDQLAVVGAIQLNGGELLVSTIDGYSPSAGTVFKVLDFASLSGDFDSVTLPALAEGLAWSTTGLLTSGEIAVILPGDYNDDGLVDAADYSVWRDNQGSSAGTLPNDADGGVIGAAQYATWVSNYGATTPASVTTQALPEPSTALLLAAITMASLLTRE